MCSTLWQSTEHVGEGPRDGPLKEEEKKGSRDQVTDQTNQHGPCVTSPASGGVVNDADAARERLPSTHAGWLLGAVGVLGLVTSQLHCASGYDSVIAHLFPGLT